MGFPGRRKALRRRWRSLRRNEEPAALLEPLVELAGGLKRRRPGVSFFSIREMGR